MPILCFSSSSFLPLLPSFVYQTPTSPLLRPKALPFKAGVRNSSFLARDSSSPSSNLNFDHVSFDWDDVAAEGSEPLEELDPSWEGAFDWEDLEIEGSEELEEMDSPWEGAIIYKRNPSVSHLEYCTTLERLGLSKVSSEISKSRASEMGLRVTKAVKDYPSGTPVQISIDVTRKKQRLRLDGIIKTVLSLSCNRCGEPAAECVYSNFSLLLSEEPVEEPDNLDMGTIFGVGDFKYSGASGGEEDDEDASIDWDDRFYFPPEAKEIDISKNIRDLVHVEITMNAVCDPKCKGICFNCGTDLNTGSCNCSEEVKEKSYGPLKNLRKQMESRF